MQYAMYLQIALMVFRFIKDLRDRKAAGDEEADVTAFVGMLAKLAEMFGIKDLDAAELTEMAPMIKELVTVVRELKK